MSVKPLEQEAEYFARLELARRKQALVEQESRDAEEERQRVFTVAQNHCPKCGAPLAGHVPQRSHRPMLALSGGLVGLWGTRTCPCRRAMVSQHPETDLCLSGYGRVVLRLSRSFARAEVIG
jgi:hypothetical protein